MAKLRTTIDQSREDNMTLIGGIIGAGVYNVEVNYGHISENGQHITITGERKDLEAIKEALEEKGHSVYIPA